GPQKQKQQRRKLIQSLKKNDRVLTAGGIIGTIVDIKDEEVVLKVDEANNTKVRVLPGAISKNMSEETS
ncbi:MAG: preprotein translocase subunit YajC, partial [Planctomycetota bacterium]